MTITDPWVGRSIRRVEDPALVRGEGRYIGDVALGMETARFVRSTMPSGVIRSIDGPCYTVADLDAAGVGEIEAVLHRPDFVKVRQPLLARHRVRFVGEPIAVVVGRSPEEAEDLAEQVVVELGPDDESLVHPDDSDTNTVIEAQFATEDIESALDHADHLVEVVLTSHRQAALPLETRGAASEFDRRTGRLTIQASTQAPHIVRTAVADLLQIPEADVQVVAPDVGGGFGQKLPLAREDIVVAWLALQRRGSVAWIEDRSENLTSSWHSRDQVYRVTGGFTADGDLLAIDAEITCDVGAWSCYPVTWGVEPLMAMGEMSGPYKVAHYRVRTRGESSFRCPMAPYRGVSRPVITASLERLMDTAARRLQIDPVEIRRRNLVTVFPHTSATGVAHDAGTYVESLDAAVEHFDLDEFRNRQSEARSSGGPLLGVGISTFAERTGYGTPVFATRAMGVTLGYETVTMTMDPSGYVEAAIGASPHGQGLETTLAQVIADQLALDVSQIRIVHGDTDRTPYGWGTFASRSMVIAGGAVHIAAGRMRDRLAQVAGAVLEASADDIVFAAGRATVAGTDVGVPIADLARIAHHHTERLAPGTPAGLAVEASYDPAGTFSNACHVAEVEIDQDTGATTVTRFVVVEDAGRLINPMIVDGQIRGGVTQGIANALFEEVVYDDDGNILTASLMDYLPPTAAEIPDIEILHLETITDATITGAKGLGEGGDDRGARRSAQRHFRCPGSLGPGHRRDAGHARAGSGPHPHERGGPMSLERRPLTLTVNDKQHQVQVEPRRTLADTLREDCGLTGTHLGCEQGVCGACTVLVDGEPVRSCLIFAVQAEDCEIVTVEGLAGDDSDLHPLQEAFSVHHALQCGFCTPGFLMLAQGVLDRQPDIDDDQLREALSSNLCRCTGYQTIIEAVRSVRDQS